MCASCVRLTISPEMNSFAFLHTAVLRLSFDAIASPNRVRCDVQPRSKAAMKALMKAQKKEEMKENKRKKHIGRMSDE